MKTYLYADHLIVSPRGDLSGIIDEELQKLGHKRYIAMSVPQFLPALSIVATTDLFATLPTRLASIQSKRYELAKLAPTLSIRPFAVSALLHERNANSPMHRWVLGALSRVANSE